MKLSCAISTVCCALMTTNARPSAPNSFNTVPTASSARLGPRPPRAPAATATSSATLCGSAHVAVLGVALGQSLKDEPCHVVIAGQPRIDFLGMAIEGVMNGFDRRVLVMRGEIDRLLVRARRSILPTCASMHAAPRVIDRGRTVGRSLVTNSAGDRIDACTATAGPDAARCAPPPTATGPSMASRSCASCAAPGTGCRSGPRVSRRNARSYRDSPSAW